MKNQGYEEVLHNQGVGFTYLKKVDIWDIDWAKGLRNQARLLNPIDDELVDQYTLRYKDKEEAPALVVWRPSPRSKFIPIDGNQRGQAMIQAKKTSTDVYLVDSQDPMVIDRLTWSFNNLVNGKRLLPEESLEHAVVFVRKYGASASDAAKEWGVNRHTLATRLAAIETREILERNKVNTSRLLDYQLKSLQPLIKVGEDVLTKAGKLVVETGLGADEINSLCKQVSHAKTQKDKLQVVEVFGKSEKVKIIKAETKGGRRKRLTRSPRDFLGDCMVDMLHLFEDHPKTALRPAGKQAFEKAREVAIDLVENLTLVFGLGALPHRAKKGVAG